MAEAKKEEHVYLCIDLKSFYASVECAERGLDAMTTNLVVADPERSEGTIFLAITPAMKKIGVKNRCRVFQIPKSVKYIMAPPRMQLYIDYSASIYKIYLKYISKDDIQVYSIDESFLDVTHYLKLYGKTAKELAVTIINDIYESLGIRAACGIGTNLYLTKIALDITEKHAADFIGELDEESYRKTLWEHTPLTDFWRIGPGISSHLARFGIYNMRELAEADEDFLYKQFGADAELLIDHAWGREPVTIADIKAFRPLTNSLSSGQVLMRNYFFDEGKIIVQEMTDLLCLDLVERNVTTDSVSLYIGYSDTLHCPPAKGTVSLSCSTSSDREIIPAAIKLYEKIVNPQMPIRRVNICCNRVEPEGFHQLTLFEHEDKDAEKSKSIQKAVLSIRKRFGKDAVLKGMNYQQGAMTITRNHQIGGHKSGE